MQMSNMRGLVRALLVWLTLVMMTAFCQDVRAQYGRAQDARAKIGVALEGGGALGLAHIGVLQWFEDHRIPIDYIAGTSMGGLIGGMYATGMRAEELRNFVSDINWNEVIDSQTPYQALSFRRKEDKRTFQNNLEFGLRGGFSAPGGLSSGQKITYLFDRATLPYSQLKTFDELPIPFRCVATDLTTGKEHVFESGSLAEAMRATMSLPAIFDPVSHGMSLWADGGLLNNLPVDVVRKMGADIVVAVYLTSSSFSPDRKQSILSVMDRSISVMIEANELHNLETADLVIPVDLAPYTGNSYGASDHIIARGTESAQKKAALVSRLAIDEPAWNQHLASRDSRRTRSTPAPEFVQVNGVDAKLSDALEKGFASHAGAPLDLGRLERDIDVALGVGRFTSISYGLTEANGKTGLELHAVEKDHAPPLLNIGFLVDGSDLANVRWTGSIRITALDIGGFRSEWRNDLSVGSTWAFSSEYYRPASATSRWFVAPRIFATNTPLDLYDHSTHLAQYRIGRYGAGADWGYAINRFSEFRVGYEAAYLRPSLTIGSAVLPEPSGRTGYSSILYRLDALDSPLVPRSGQFARLRAGWADAAPGSAGGFPLAEASFGVIRRVNKRGSAYVQMSGGSTFDHWQTGIPQFFLGGPNQLSAYGRNELRTNEYWLGRVGYVHELFSLPPLIGQKAYFTAAYELAKTYRTPGASRVPNDGNFGLVFETLFGPLFMGGSVGDTGHRRVYFSLGRFF
jgi:NTE family protein